MKNEQILELLESAKAVLAWYDRDGSVGGCDEAVTNLRQALENIESKAVGWRKCVNELPPIGEAVIVRWDDGRARIMSREEAPEEPGKHCWCWLPDCPDYDWSRDMWLSIDAEWEPGCDGDPPVEWSYLPR